MPKLVKERKKNHTAGQKKGFPWMHFKASWTQEFMPKAWLLTQFETTI